MDRFNRLNKLNNGIDYSNIEDAFYTQNFTIPEDEITDRFRKTMESQFYISGLPISIVSGLPILEPNETAEIKVRPSYKKLIAGEYATQKAKYDATNVKQDIDFFVNNLPSFKKYKRRDNLDWVIKEHRLLGCEIFEYYNNNKTSMFTISRRYNGILRIMKIAFENKKSFLYKLTSAIQFQIYNFKQFQEGENKLNKYEQNKFILWQDVLKIQANMEKKFNEMKNKDTAEAYDANNDLLLLSLYCLIPPLRNEIKHLEFVRGDIYINKDYVHIRKDGKKTLVTLLLNKDKKLHTGIEIDIMKGKYSSPHLGKLLIESYTLYPRDYVFTLKNNYPYMDQKASQRALDERLVNIFYKHGIQNQISLNSLRSSYISYMWSDPDITYNDKRHIAKQMRSSVDCLENNYRKILKDGKPKIDEASSASKSNSSTSSSLSEYHTAESQLNNLSPIRENSQSFEHNDNDAYLSDLSDSSSDSPESSDPNKNDDCREMKIPKALTQYQRKQERKKKYYKENKQKILEKAREYANRMTPFEKTRARALALLNNSQDYQYKIKQATIDKYKFYKDEATGKWHYRVQDDESEESSSQSSSKEMTLQSVSASS